VREARVTMQTFQEIPKIEEYGYRRPYLYKDQQREDRPDCLQGKGAPDRALDLGLEETITVRKAVTVEDMVKVFHVRWEGYKKYFKSEEENMDEHDFSSETTLLLAEDKHHNPVGTMRILDRRYGSIELDKFVNLNSFLSEGERVCIEATRFSIPKHPQSKLIKLLLWKSLLLYCQINHIDTILMSVRPAAARSYQCLLFENVGPSGAYRHSLLKNLEHQTYKCNISDRKKVIKKVNWPLYHFFFIEDHSNINTDYFTFYIPETVGNLI